jgi:hypothetical protein
MTDDPFMLEGPRIPRPGAYVRFVRRCVEWPYRESAYGIVTGTPKNFRVRIRALDTRKTHVYYAGNVEVVGIEEARGSFT